MPSSSVQGCIHSVPRKGGAPSRPAGQCVQPDAPQRFAHWALHLSPQVSLEPPDGVLVEIGGSLRLFGGPDPILHRVTDHLREMETAATTAAAPTPRGAWLLARAGGGPVVTDRNALRHALGPLPCRVLDLTPRQGRNLDRLRLHTLGACLALPRAGLRRRLGAEVVQQLDQALGSIAEPRRYITPPRRYHQRLELPTASHSGTGVLFIVARLLRELAAVLRGADAAVGRFTVTLEHPRRAATRCTVGTLRPIRDADSFIELAGHHLERTHPPDAIHAAAVTTEAFQPYRPPPTALPLGEHATAYDPVRLWERLAARIGPECIHGLAIHPDPRPERAWRHTSFPGKAPAETPAITRRPWWLLPRPQRLRESSGTPHGLPPCCCSR